MIKELDQLTDNPNLGIETLLHTLKQQITCRQDLSEVQKQRLYQKESKALMAAIVVLFLERLQTRHLLADYSLHIKPSRYVA